MSQPLLLLCVGPLTFSLCFIFNWLALIPWRRARTAHWSEQARFLWPINVSAQTLRWLSPILLVLTSLLFDSTAPGPFLAAVGFLAAIGSFLGTIPMDREIFPRIPLATLIRQTGIGFVFSLFYWVVFIAAVVSMPAHLGWEMAGVAGAFIAFRLFWSHSGALWIGRKIGLMTDAPDRLKRITDAAASTAGVSYRQVWLLRSDAAQALAFPNTRDLVFTERIIMLLTDEELTAICAHELGHLTESKGVRVLRNLNSFTSLPWIFVTPLAEALGPVGFYLPLLCTILLPRIFLPLSQRLEVRADQVAARQEESSGCYANALLKIHEDNLTTVVNSGKQSTHPHLYDRVIAAGITPDFPRPQPPATMSWPGLVFSLLLGVLVSVTLIRRFG
jgi:Zn-dependent protease with chaperone function